MRIVVLDGYTLNPGDLSWEGLEALGQCVVHDRTAPEDTVSRSEGAAILLTNKTPVRREHLDQLMKAPTSIEAGRLACSTRGDKVEGGEVLVCEPAGQCA